MLCRSCGYKLYRCENCGAIGCRHPQGWDVCPAQVFRERNCRVCNKRTNTRAVREHCTYPLIGKGRADSSVSGPGH